MKNRVIKLAIAIGTGLAGFVLLLGGILGLALRALPATLSRWARGETSSGNTPRKSFVRGFFLGMVSLIVFGAVIGGLIMVSGIVSIRASSGHWPITYWFLDFGKHRSVSTNSLGIKPPASLDDPEMILKGALHYDIGCRSCHGSPEMKYPRIPQQMTAKPPYLTPGLDEWEARELFYIVKHGIKFTGMPGWATQKRDDEIWAVVSFLRKFPHLDAEDYRQLVGGGPVKTTPVETLDLQLETQNAITQTCARCHGHDGIARGNGAFPHLAGQREDYLRNSMKAYIDGTRHSGIMEPIAAGLNDAQINEMARFYASLPAAPPKQPDENDLESIALGQKIATQGIPKDRIPSCIDCHEPTGRRAKSSYPSLAGQPADYLILQLELFQKRTRGGSDYEHLMHHVVDRLEPDEIRALALYFESLTTSIQEGASEE